MRVYLGGALLLFLLPIASSFTLLPQFYHHVPMAPAPLLYLLPQQPLLQQQPLLPQQPLLHQQPLLSSPLLLKPPAPGIMSTVDVTSEYSALPNLTGRALPRDIPLINRVAATRNGPRNIDLCYFLGQDIFTSHVRCNPNWADGTNDGVKRYINEMTYETNKMVGLNNLRLVWKGPYVRTEGVRPEQEGDAIRYDVLSVAKENCDAAIFLLFNQFSEDCKTTTTGHKFGGVSYGGMCEVPDGRGYAVVVDQGFLKDAWTGPQILAHHLLLMLTSDLPDKSKHCPNQESLLYPKLDPGKQRVDQCVVDKLTRSGVSRRPCMQD